MKDLGNEIEFKNSGIMQKRANEVLNNAYELLREMYYLSKFL